MARGVGLQRTHVLRSRALLALDNLELYPLPFAQGPETLCPDSAVVDKDIATALALNEAEAFGIIEPFDGSSLPVGHE